MHADFSQENMSSLLDWGKYWRWFICCAVDLKIDRCGKESDQLQDDADIQGRGKGRKEMGEPISKCMQSIYVIFYLGSETNTGNY